MKPFLLLGTRDDDRAADAEYAAVLQHTGLPETGLHRIRVESEPLPPLNLDDYSGILLGGSQFNASDAVKSPAQLRVEADLDRLAREAVERDYPFLGMCYGVGVITTVLGGMVDSTYSEPVGAITVTLTDEGRRDPLLVGIADEFLAFVGHKEACASVPPGSVVLATGAACPVQMYRVKSNIYVTQFHPELNAEQLAARMRLYQHHGYFRPDELEDLIAAAHAAAIGTSAHRVLQNFIVRYWR